MVEKHICVVTGSRSEYGNIILLLKKIQESKKLKLSLLVTGMHLLKKYGNTIDYIKKDGFSIAKIVPMFEENDTSEVSLGKAVGNAIKNFTEVLYELNPDIIIVIGDRFESLAAAIAASTLLIPIAHIHGGDNIPYGQIDEQIRHSLTKLSHIHFPPTPKSAKRIKLMGEEEWRIHMVGAIAIDMIVQEKLLEKEEICKKLFLNPSEKIILCVQHPYTFKSDKAGDQMKITLQVLKDLNLQTLIIYPNNDPGNDLIINEIEKYRSFQKFKIAKSLERRDYLSILRSVDLVIGNSSSGIVETPLFKIPVVNIGNRNKGREQAKNIIDVLHDYNEIKNAVVMGLSDDFKRNLHNLKNPFGDGKSSERIVKILENLELNKNKLLLKVLSYNV